MKKCIEQLIVAALILSFAGDTLSQQRQTQPVEFRNISDRLFEITGGQGAQGGVYIGNNGVVIIDAKMSKTSVDQVIENIRRITDKPIKYLVNTHSDGDHVTGNRYFPETVTFVAHENCWKDFFQSGRDGSPSEWSKPELSPFVPSLTFTDKMDIHLVSQNIELWYFGVGHTTGDIVVYFPEEKAAFVGDQLFLTRPQLIHSYKGGNSFEHIKTLTKMLGTINAQKFYSGHSEVTDRTGVENHIEQVKKYQEKVKTLIEKGELLEEIKSEFAENEARLIETIYSEIQARPDR